MAHFRVSPFVKVQPFDVMHMATFALNFPRTRVRVAGHGLDHAHRAEFEAGLDFVFHVLIFRTIWTKYCALPMHCLLPHISYQTTLPSIFSTLSGALISTLHVYWTCVKCPIQRTAQRLIIAHAAPGTLGTGQLKNPECLEKYGFLYILVYI